MSARKPAVGDIRHAKHRWQVFNDNYEIVELGERRRPYDFFGSEKPWAAFKSGMDVNRYFETHAEALAFALSDGAE